jgi:hypothetical protein
VPKISFEEFVDGKQGELEPPPPTLPEHLEALETFGRQFARQLDRANELLYLLRATGSTISPGSETDNNDPRPSGIMPALSMAMRRVHVISEDLDMVLARLAGTLGAPDAMPVVPSPSKSPQPLNTHGFRSAL